MSLPGKKIDKDVRDPFHSKPHICPQCGFRTTNKGNLTRHAGSTKCKTMMMKRARALNKPPSLDDDDDDDGDDDDDEVATEAAAAAADVAATPHESHDSNEEDESHDGDDDDDGVAGDDGGAPKAVRASRICLDRLWNDMYRFRVAAGYLQNHNTLKRHIVAIEEAIAQAKKQMGLAMAEREAVQARVDEAAKTHANANRIANETLEALAAKRAHLEEVTKEHDDLKHKHSGFVNLNALVARRMDECIAEFKAALPQGVSIQRTVAAHYSDEQGIIEGVRLDAFVDRVSPGLRERLAQTATAIKKAQDDVSDLLRIQVDAMAAVAEAVRRLETARQEFVAKSEAVEAVEALCAEWSTELAALEAREENEFLRNERDTTGEFGDFPPGVRRLIEQMRGDHELVKEIGDLAYRIERLIPRAMVNRFPFVLNNTVLGRFGIASDLFPDGTECTLCKTVLLTDAASRHANPIVATSCDHYFHVACIETVYAKERACHEDAFHKPNSAASIPCPDCGLLVFNTTLALIGDCHYHF